MPTRGPGEEPDTNRRLLRTKLISLRKAMGLSQAEAANLLSIGVAKVSRIEKGQVSITVPDVLALLRIYGVEDSSQIAQMVEWAKGTRGVSWMQYSGIYRPPALDLFTTEQGATAIYKYEATFIPGLLQTEAYMRHLLPTLGDHGDKLEMRIESRLKRQQLLDSETVPKLHFVIAEPVIRRPMVEGEPEVMRGQIDRLKVLSQKPNVSLQIIPFNAGYHRRIGGAFTIVKSSGAPDLLYIENADGEASNRGDETLTADYLRDFEELSAMGCSPDKFVEVVERISQLN